MLFHLLSKFYEHTSVVIMTNLDFAEWSWQRAIALGIRTPHQNSALNALEYWVRASYYLRPPGSNARLPSS